MQWENADDCAKPTTPPLTPDHSPLTTHHPPPTTPRCRPSAVRRLIEASVLFFSVLLLFRAIGAEPYGVPTGSMSPALLGNHKAVTCPRCGYPVLIGCHDEPQGGRTGDDHHAACPNCGCADLQLERVPVCRGDHLLVNKNVYEWRRPRRWEMAVFRCPADPGRAFVKRVVGLPGESLLIRDGDLYVDDELARKSLAEFKALRVPIFDNNYPPTPEGWACRWLTQPNRGPASLEGSRLRLETVEDRQVDLGDWQWLVYRHWDLDENKARGIRDEYTYNGGDNGRTPEPVHDFMLECDVEVVRGLGWLAFGITDGLDQLIAELPAGGRIGGARLVGVTPVGRIANPSYVYRTAPELALKTGTRYHVELAFVDRRATLAIDGTVPFAPLDRPAAEQRAEVERPVKVGARGVDVVVSNFCLYRDVHYTAAGKHASRTPVRLGAGQYFVLGDNSPNSEDNRFWSDPADNPLPVPEASFLGKPFLVHLPSRIVQWDAFGRQWEFQTVAWERVRWLR